MAAWPANGSLLVLLTDFWVFNWPLPWDALLLPSTRKHIFNSHQYPFLWTLAVTYILRVSQFPSKINKIRLIPTVLAVIWLQVITVLPWILCGFAALSLRHLQKCYSLAVGLGGLTASTSTTEFLASVKAMIKTYLTLYLLFCQNLS